MNRFMVVRRNYSFLCFACCTLVGVSGSYAGENEGTTFVEVHFEGANGVSGLDGVNAVAVSPDGADVYVTSADNFSFPSVTAITHFARDLATGRLAFQSTMLDPLVLDSHRKNPSNLTLSRDGRFLYVAFLGRVGNLDDTNDAIVAFARGAATGELTFVANHVNGTDGITNLFSPTDIVSSPDDRHLYVSAVGSLVAFERDIKTGELSFVHSIESEPGVVPLEGAYSLDISEDGAHVYVTSHSFTGPAGISIFGRNAATGQLTFVGFVTEGVDGVVGLESPWNLELSGDGQNCYAVSRTNEGTTVAVFVRDEATGALTFLEAWLDGHAGGSSPFPQEDILVAPDGGRVYVVSRDSRDRSAQVSAFLRDPQTGALTPEEDLVDGAAGPTILSGEGWTAISPDSAHLYIASNVQDSLTVLSACLPTELCDEFPLVEQEFVGFQEAFPFTKGFDNEGLPLDATVALVEGAACDGSDFALRESSINAYHINRATYDFDSSANSSEVEDLKRAISVLMLVSDSMQVAVKDALLAGGVTLADQYVAVTCASGECLPNRGSGPAPRLADEPFSGSGDADDDGISNLDEYLAITGIGGTIADFVAVALNPALDGSVIPVRAGAGGGGGCLIATAAYGTPLAQDLDTLRAARDSYLMTNPFGAAFADTYYRISPPIADAIAGHTALRAIVRALLVPVVFVAGANSSVGWPMVVVVLAAFVLAMFLAHRRRVVRS